MESGREPVGRLDGHEGEVEGDADREGAAVAVRRGVGMPVIVMAGRIDGARAWSVRVCLIPEPRSTPPFRD